MRKISSGFFLTLLRFAVAGVSTDHIAIGKIIDANKHSVRFNSTHTDASKTGRTSSNAIVYLKISAAKESVLYNTSFVPTRITSDSAFTQSFTPLFS